MAKRGKKNAVLGMDLGTQSVKTVEMVRKGEDLAVVACVYEPVDDASLYDEAIKRAVKSAKAKKVVIGFGGRSTLIQNLTLPANRQDELDAAVLEEAEKYIPYDISEAQLDYHVLPGAADGQIRAILAAARQQDIADKLDILFQAGVTPARIDVELVALANALETANLDGSLLGLGRAGGMVNFGASKTLIAISDGVNTVFRDFPVGGIALTELISQRLGCDLAEAERFKLRPGDRLDTVKDAIYPGLEDIAGEIRSCLDTFKSAAGGKEAARLFLSGGLVGFAGVADLIGRMTQIETSVFDSFGSVDAGKATADVVEAHGHELAVAFGLACHARD
ncbi:MAG: type IV pilus assembly protein PilM [Planctomycetota bacterium]|nr:type IV pilus assembly protein PilM [Planctomycetota bacterium]